ncbi:MAG: ABC transporter permease [Chloroflexi bacterium]|nr:MAG: ABC transporter permease [Chloroflexota bacterium]
MHVDLKKELTTSGRGRLGLAVFLLMVLIALFAPLLAGHDPVDQSRLAFQSPSLSHWLGTNHVGQDIWSQLVYGARTSLLVGLSVALLSTLLSALVGASAALIGGLYDSIIMRLVDALIVIPVLLVLILVAAYLQPSLWVLIILLSLLGWQGGARIVRAQALSLKERTHVSAARCFGGSRLYLIWRHILPDLSPILLVEFIYSMRRAVFMEAGLAFLGIADPNMVSWGMMMREALDFSYLNVWLWWLLPAGAALSLTIVSVTFVGYTLEPAMEPRLRGEVYA